MIVVESELDAYAIDHAVGDMVCAVAVGNNLNRPDEATNYYAENSRHLLICHDNDDAGHNMLDRWRAWYNHAQPFPTPIGKDIGEAIQQGLKIRPWLLQYKWQDHPDQDLMNYILTYINDRPLEFKKAYRAFEEEILLGPDSPRARTGELKQGFTLMREIIENNSN